MPELPEVETTRRGLLPHVVGRRIRDVVVRNRQLRWPVTPGIARRLRGEEVLGIRRRGKYLLFDCPSGHLLVHLGMSGRLSVVPAGTPPKVHDHVDVELEGDGALRLTDPRRFGAVLWLARPAEGHALLSGLGVEPFDEAFNAETMRALARGRRVTIKQLLMNGRIVTGVGNIYASEALFAAGIDPRTPAGRLSRARWARLVAEVRDTLERALASGGSTLRDYARVDGRAGGFQHVFSVYDKEGKPCPRCGKPIRQLRQGQRSTFYCPGCQR